MDTNFYDVIVCGGEIAGLCAGALLARRGFRVMVLGHEPWSAAFDAEGTTLSAAPALLPPLDEPPIARVLKELDTFCHWGWGSKIFPEVPEGTPGRGPW